MNKKILGAVVAGITFLTGINASAAYCYSKDWGCGSIYISGAGSIDWHRNIEFKTESRKEKLHFNLGGDASVAAGYMIDDWRLEIEGIFKYNSLDNLDLTESGGTTVKAAPGAHIRDWALMANLFYEVPIEDCFSLFVGAGIGVDFKELSVANYSRLESNFDSISERYTLFAWQLKAGISYELTPCISLFTGYAFFASTKPGSFARGIGGASTTARWVNSPYYHCIEGGIRFKI